MSKLPRVFAILSTSLLAILGRAAPKDEATVARLDREYQAAVKVNDAQTMDRIQHKDMVLVLGNGNASTGAELIAEARSKSNVYERQDEDPGTQSVRVYKDTAVVTARLWIKGVTGGKTFDRRLWFSDTYVRTPQGWKYFFGQASLHLRDEVPTQ